MDIQKLDHALALLVEKNHELNALDYNDKNYDRVEEDLHDMEDDFLDEYGDFLEEVLRDVHDEYCPDSDVLLPIAYLAKQYQKTEKEDGSVHYDASVKEGVLVDADAYPDQLCKLVLVPGPTRLILNIKNKEQKVVWTA